MKITIALLCIVLLAGCTTTNKHLWGYEKAIYVKNDLPDVLLYWPAEGVENKVWWFMPTVQERAKQLSIIQYGYVMDDIACDHTGDWLYIGVD